MYEPPYHYAYWRYREAVEVLCTKSGKRYEQLYAAYMSGLYKLRSDEPMPKDILKKHIELMEAFSALKEKMPDYYKGLGAVKYTLTHAHSSHNRKIAKLITEIYLDLESGYRDFLRESKHQS